MSKHRGVSQRNNKETIDEGFRPFPPLVCAFEGWPQDSAKSNRIARYTDELCFRAPDHSTLDRLPGLAGRGPALGGKLRLEASLPNRGEYLGLIAWWERQLKQGGVEVHANTLIQDADDVRRFGPDVVILATGSHQRPPDDLPGVGMSARDWAQDPDTRNRHGATAVLFDKDHTAATYALAEELSGKYAHVFLLTPRTHIAQNVNYCSSIGVHRRLHEADVNIVTAAEPVSLADRVLEWRDVFTDRRRTIPEVDLFLWSTPRIADDQLYDRLKTEGLEVLLAGDCMSPRNALCAVHEGHTLALSL